MNDKPNKRVIVECCFAVVPEELLEDELLALHCAACVALELKSYRVAAMVSGPGSVFWMLLGATLEQVQALEDWLAENGPLVQRHTVMYYPLPGKEVER